MASSRREFIKRSSLLSAYTALNISPAPIVQAFNQEGDRLVLLGTQGGPLIRSYKQTPSANVIVHKNIPFVIDAGYGVTFKLLDAGVKLSTLKYIFITHHHSDHNLELGILLYNAWIAGLAETVDVYAPIGVKALLAAFWESNKLDIDIRIKDEGRPDIRTLVVPHEITEGMLISIPEFEISCLKVIHPPIDDSFGFKFKFDKSTIVFSGDTTYCPALATFASGADYLIHEAMYGPGVDEMVKRRPKNAVKLKASILSHHTLAEDIGKIASEAKVKNLILNHFVPPDDKSITDEVWINAVRKNFPGHIIVGKDLLQIGL